MRITERAGIVAIALLTVTPSLGLMDRISSTAEMTTTFNPVADAFVDATKPGRNFGTNQVLQADSRPVKRAFLRFSVAVDGPVSSASLRLFGRQADEGLRIVPVASQSWGEKGITYNNAPSFGAVMASSPPAAADSWRSFDVTDRVQAGGLVSFAVLGKEASGAVLGSLESGRPPQLVVQQAPLPPSASPSSSVSPSASPSSLPSPSPSASPTQTVRGLFRDGDIDLGTVGSLGFNLVTVNPYPEDLNELSSARLKGLVWLGGYDSALCQFRKPVEWVTERLEEVGSHPAIHSFFIDDEPHADCPNVRQQMINRSHLVETLVPGAITVLTENRGEDFDTLANTTDVMGIIVYPCSKGAGCVFSKIDERIAQAEAAGVERYWGAPQSFGDEYYKMPTSAEQIEIFRRWNASRMEGYLGYAWSSNSDPETLDTHPELWDAWTVQN
jgi:hypothetical protein